MVIAVRTEQAGAELVVVKAARTDGDVARLTREARMLQRCRHPGVVELLGVDDRSITLRHGGTPLARLGPLPIDEAVGVVSAIADVVGALHRIGVAHGDLDPDHVLIDQRGKPRLCGFGQATEVAPAEDESRDARSTDVAALGRLLGALLESGGDLPWRTAPPGWRKGASRRRARRELEVLVAQTTSAEPAKRPTARQFAKALHVAVPELHLPTRTAPNASPGFAVLPDDVSPTDDIGWTADDLHFLALDRSHDGDLDRSTPSTMPETPADDVDRARIAAPQPESAIEPRVPPVAVPAIDPAERRPGTSRARSFGAAAALLVVLCVGALAGAASARAVRPFGGQDLDSSVAASTPTTSPSVSVPSPTTTEPPAAASVSLPAHCTLAETDTPAADVDGDGCPDTVVLDGRVATIRSLSVTIGSPGDIVVLGDFDCDGLHTAAVLRPSSGEVFVFAEWHLTEPVQIGPLSIVVGATDLHVRTGPGGCSTLEATTPTGRTTVRASQR